MTWPNGSGGMGRTYEYEERTDHARRMEEAFGRLALVRMFILTGSRLATDKQRAARFRIEDKLIELARKL
jgi:putative hemolysin